MSNENLNIDSAADEIAELMGDDEQAFDGPEENEELAQEIEQPETDQLTDDGAESEPEEAADDALEEETEGTLESLQELADALEISLEDVLANVKTTFKAAGEDTTVNLAELQKSYQTEADYRKKSMALADERRNFETDHQKQVQAFQANSAGLAQMVKFNQQMLMNKLNSPQLAELRETDPGRWTAERHELEQQYNMLNGVRDKAAQDYQSFMDSQHRDFMAKQGAILSESVEGWGEEKLGVAVEAMQSLGIDQEEVAQIGDARLIRGALELAELRAENAELKAKITQSSEMAQKVKKEIPNLVKPSNKKNPQTKKRSDLRRKLRENKKGNANLDAAAALIENIIL